MPELPDLTVFAENVDKAIRGKRITAVKTASSLRLNVPAQALNEALQNGKVEAVERWGKEVRIRLAAGRMLYIHLMLTGGFVLTRDPGGIRFFQLGLGFDDGVWLFVADEKGMAMVALDPDREGAASDALEVTADRLRELIGRYPRAKAKAFLIDQKVMRGIGNAYADEILWEARVAPASVVGKLPGEVVGMVAEKIPEVLQRAIVAIKERNPGIIAGELRDFLLVHNPARKTSPTGRPIVKEKIGGKTTYYTDEQQLYL